MLVEECCINAPVVGVESPPLLLLETTELLSSSSWLLLSSSVLFPPSNSHYVLHKRIPLCPCCSVLQNRSRQILFRTPILLLTTRVALQHPQMRELCWHNCRKDLLRNLHLGGWRFVRVGRRRKMVGMCVFFSFCGGVFVPAEQLPLPQGLDLQQPTKRLPGPQA